MTIKDNVVKNRVRETELRIKSQRDINILGSSEYDFYQNILEKWLVMDHREKTIRIMMMHMFDKQIHVKHLARKLIVSPSIFGNGKTAYLISLDTNDGLGMILRVKPEENYYFFNSEASVVLKVYGDHITAYLDYFLKAHRQGDAIV